MPAAGDGTSPYGEECLVLEVRCGRARELTEITDAVTGVRDDAPGLVLVVAPPGLGKTGPLRQAAAELAEEARAESQPLGGPDCACAGVIGAGQVPGPSRSEPAAGIPHCPYRLTADLAAPEPLLLCIDDLQWADRASPPDAWCRPVGLPRSTLLPALLEQDRLDEAEEPVLAPVPAGADESWQWNHFLEARGRWRLARGDPHGCLRDLLECGHRNAAWRREHPGVSAWRSVAVRAYAAIGDTDRPHPLPGVAPAPDIQYRRGAHPEMAVSRRFPIRSGPGRAGDRTPAQGPGLRTRDRTPGPAHRVAAAR